MIHGPGIDLCTRVLNKVSDDLGDFPDRLRVGDAARVRTAADSVLSEIGGDHAGEDTGDVDLRDGMDVIVVSKSAANFQRRTNG